MSSSSRHDREAPYELDDALKGPPLKHETISYAHEVRDIMQAGFESEEDRQIFLDNVFAEFAGHEFRLAVNTQGSAALEALLAMCDARHLRGFASRLSDKLFALCTDRKASHVMQALLRRVPAVLLDEYRHAQLHRDALQSGPAGPGPDGDADEDEEQVPPMQEIFASMCDELESFWPDMAVHHLASHVMRDVLLILAGFTDLAEADKLFDPKFKFTTPPDFAQDAVGDVGGAGGGGGSSSSSFSAAAAAEAEDDALLLDHLDSVRHVLPGICKVIGMLDGREREMMMTSTSGSVVLQTLLHCLSHLTRSPGSHSRVGTRTAMTNLMSKLLLWDSVSSTDGGSDGGGDGDGDDHRGRRASSPSNERSQLDFMLFERCASHLVETMLRLAPVDVFEKLYRVGMRGRLLELSQHASANHCVQMMIFNIRTSKHLKEVVAELLGKFGLLYERNRMGVVYALVQAAVRLGSRQHTILRELLDCLGCGELPKNFVENLAFNVGPRNRYSGITHLGCLIATELLKFEGESNRKIVLESFAHLDNNTVFSLATDGTGSRVIEAVVTTDAPAHYRRKFLEKFEGQFARLAQNTFGSFCLEKMFSVADTLLKKTIAIELFENKHVLRNDFRGRNLLHKLHIDQFEASPMAWQQRESSKEKKFRALAELFGEDLGNREDAQTERKKKRKRAALTDGDEEAGGAADAEVEIKMNQKDEKKKMKKKKRKYEKAGKDKKKKAKGTDDVDEPQSSAGQAEGRKRSREIDDDDDEEENDEQDVEAKKLKKAKEKKKKVKEDKKDKKDTKDKKKKKKKKKDKAAEDDDVVMISSEDEV